MGRGEKRTIALTGENSHVVEISAGQGSFSIGALGMNAKKFDVLVDPALPINWNCFNSFFTGHGEENASLYPLGDWPRFFYYWGNDSNFIHWSEKRKIEDFTWCPNKPISEDLSNSNINRLSLQIEKNRLELQLGRHQHLSLTGNLEKCVILNITEIGSLSLSPTLSKKESKPYQLPSFEALKKLRSVSIYVEPLGQAFDCASLLQFEHLKSLSLSGNLSNLQSLEKLKNLERLAIRYAPNLDHLPALKNWGKLTSFIGWNIETTKGKLLRSEVKQLAKERKVEYSSVTQLRTLIWFTTEYGMPFSAWTGKKARLAVKNYKAAVKRLKKASSKKEIKAVLIEFAKAFNTLPEIETTEREAIGEAIDQLRQVPSLEIEAKKAIEWFDKVRTY
ncbi:MAG: Unknown protein [uncultured Aureispira sp.]|uniref:Uncharacterized protein n=1 Tax=uncultured Aureispira sp. TaxID=1331704 RepID=A0A6S6SXM6_9BACT|nr:MAG: Unknown protein [uncultured Aureispira sp.]